MSLSKTYNRNRQKQSACLKKKLFLNNTNTQENIILQDFPNFSRGYDDDKI